MEVQLFVFPVDQIIFLLIRGSISALFEPMFWMILALVGYQYWQLQRNQIRMFGVYGYTLRRQVTLAAIYGLIGGLVGSFLLVSVGLTVNQLGLAYIWPVALVLMAIHMRFLCFAYAGGLVALSSVLFGWPEVNVPQVLSLVAILHITESILIFISGRYSAVPLIMRREDGKMVGAFSLQNFWPLPLVMLGAVSMPEASIPAGGVIDMPDWWPLLPLNLEMTEGYKWIYAMTSVIAALGYSDVAIASLPGERRRQSAFHLAIYSIVLLILAVLSARYHWLQAVAALVSPLGHELLIQWDNRRELNGAPRYIPPDEGIMILDTVVDSPARKIGLQPGDIIYYLAGIPINNGYDLSHALSYAPPEFSVQIKRDNKEHHFQAKFANGERRLGIILVPQGNEEHFVEMRDERFWLWEWLKRAGRR